MSVPAAQDPAVVAAKAVARAAVATGADKTFYGAAPFAALVCSASLAFCS